MQYVMWYNNILSIMKLLIWNFDYYNLEFLRFRLICFIQVLYLDVQKSYAWLRSSYNTDTSVREPQVQVALSNMCSNSHEDVMGRDVRNNLGMGIAIQVNVS